MLFPKEPLSLSRIKKKKKDVDLCWFLQNFHWLYYTHSQRMWYCLFPQLQYLFFFLCKIMHWLELYPFTQLKNIPSLDTCGLLRNIVEKRNQKSRISKMSDFPVQKNPLPSNVFAGIRSDRMMTTQKLFTGKSLYTVSSCSAAYYFNFF